MMIGTVRALAVMLLLAGCIPDFQLDTRSFADTGLTKPPEDASEPDAAADAAADAAPDASDGGPGDADPADADPIDADPLDADPPDAEPPDMGFTEDCTNGTDDDMDEAADCADLDDCDLYVGSGWQCRDGVRAETDCHNNLDDDGNQSFDCHDPDCGCTAGILTCCPNGMCLSLGDLCD
jgi:hypothetical protein